MKCFGLGDKVRRYFWVLLFATYSVSAAGVVIDVLGDEYRHLSRVAATTVDSDEDTRMSGASQAAAVYRASSGAPFSALPPGSMFKMVWPDGSSEYVMVVTATSSVGVEPIPSRARRESVPVAGRDAGDSDASADASSITRER